MLTEIPYEAGGQTMVGTVALPEGDGPFPAVLIAHEGNGLDDFQKQRTQRFADLGYAAFSLDYHGDGRPLTERDAINARLTTLMDDTQLCRSVATAGLDVLLALPVVDPHRVVAVGYCFGGTMMLELARTGAPLLAVVAMHPGLSTKRPEDSVNIRGKVLVCIGHEDPIVPIEQRLAFESEMRSAHVDWQMHLYGGVKHSFTHPREGLEIVPGLEYNVDADRRSWRSMMMLFDEVLATQKLS